MIELKNLTIKKAQESMEKGEYTSKELVSAYLEQIKKTNTDIHAYLEVFGDAVKQAEEADLKRKNGDKGTLLGIPFAIKDNIVIEGRRVGAASKILENYVAPYDATAIKKLKEAGAVFLGRVNMDEFAMGGSTENSAYGVTKNPLDITRVSGGSSGGSAAAVAMDGALVSLGSDTGGSIRQPASYCGVVGLKPTYGSVSRHGLMAMGSSLDVIGPITRSVEDAELVFNVLKGKDIYDSTSLSEEEVRKLAQDHKESKSLRIGIVPELMNMGGINPAVLENLNTSIELLKKNGCEIKEVSLPHIKYSLAVYYILMPAEVSSNMSRFDGVKFGSKVEGNDLLGDYVNTRGELLGKEVRRRIMLGTYVLSSGYYDAYYNKANIVRELITADFKKAFEEVDVILTPTAPTPAFKIGSHTSDPIQMYLEDVFTVTANLVGTPAMSVPSGTSEGLPLGVQFTAPHCREDLLFTVGKKFEQIRGF
jgi:aspartyl-tRNA(Asn)/glutamyl-tRNA(Gln) amidotransferase subunit A